MTRPAVLLTGGAGYIGSHTAKALAREGFLPVTLDDLSNGQRESVRWGPLVVGDIGDAALVKRLCRDYEIKALLHLAALKDARQSIIHPSRYFQVNLEASLVLLRTLSTQINLKAVVFSSTCAVYGNPLSLPINETHPVAPLTPYGESKLALERLLPWLAREAGFRWISLRYFNAAGADPEGEIGEYGTEAEHLLARVMAVALGEQEVLPIHGVDHPTPDGTPIRDYVHVSDIARAHVIALRKLLTSHGTLGDQNLGMTVNLGSGRGYSVREVVRALESRIGRTIPIQEGRARANEVSAIHADMSMAIRQLDWTPERSELETMVDDAWRWRLSLNTSSIPGKQTAPQ